MRRNFSLVVCVDSFHLQLVLGIARHGRVAAGSGDYAEVGVFTSAGTAGRRAVKCLVQFGQSNAAREQNAASSRVFIRSAVSRSPVSNVRRYGHTTSGR